MEWTVLFENICFGISLLMIFSGEQKDKLYKYVICFGLLMLSSHFLLDWGYNVWFAHISILALCFHKKGNFSNLLHKCLYATFIWLFTTYLFASTIVLVAPSFFKTTAYNISINIIIVGVSLVWKFLLSKKIWKPTSKKSIQCCTIIELCMLSFNIFLPNILKIGIHEFAIISVVFLTYTALVLCFIAVISTAEIKVQNEKHMLDLERQYDATFSVLDFYKENFKKTTKLIENNQMFALRQECKHFESLISDGSINEKILNSISNSIIRNLLRHTLELHSYLQAVDIQISISGNINIPETELFEVYQDLKRRIHNAMHSVIAQGGGTIELYFSRNDNDLTILVAHTYDIKNSEKHANANLIEMFPVEEPDIKSSNLKLEDYIDDNLSPKWAVSKLIISCAPPKSNIKE